MSAFANKVRIVEVGARDGLQNEKTVSTEDKVTLINALAAAGLKDIEAGAFVSPKWVPQMADSSEVISALDLPEINLSALTPNLKGAQAAHAVGIKEFAIFTAASEAFCQKNINCSIAQSIDRFSEVMTFAKANNIRVRGYVSCVLGCPYEGDVDPQVVLNVAQKLLALGCYEVSLGDTIGVGTAGKVTELLTLLLKHIDKSKLAVHFHDTYGQALTNIYAALSLGISTVDAAVAGLGGCPYAKGASGNVATEDVVYLLQGLGIEHGIDLKRLAQAGWQITNALNKQPVSKVSVALHTQ
ncbi:MAG: hydroxymethylglutaryl-CoA lyase [Pseudoalteromonas tetraodonis]|jgi:hydroxymethylglutaryl-CoA lyase|uniref:hydroxymethylglutaryl-CoA lyase n=3 Tax=Pseudoalteromonas TaxID=53246 RepID=A0AA37S3W6_9GAMM|nr:MULTISPECIES: hydroxymethylglutaryl-CoA lyase [Pseudoalteromonas]ADT68425.1 hydroxymethylglutaryl-CoA lyase (HMG-CoA lyase) (HL) (3-hydroxy-3-methylglutarate-CoA lyase) [Pseudoalteromonas sp. SM9913]ATD03141.1 hydroxymethylglutaryl-CoA lyase [Pseudoalteromonas tetraodonis]KGK01484.1 Hydroxymethylglutaryl-CoA lyase [Pseudoalteromonas sp. ND6B]KYL33515.1 hydroxymethylglutaryl-CoA lyase [Pseudoalteromonas spiralis]MAY58903.1 hydroxymethylglutaryl-CoA lyase [Pseudoalteromonas sp.]|tara:strand:- start:869 stop:1765 length:897 start_codon:yes stop_codon:yes gene_type:complete